jgi:uncharacterized membrane protein
MIDWREVRVAIAATRPYLLSHHESADWDRCYAPRIRGRPVRVCARCLGVYPGIAVGLLVAALGWPLPTGPGVVAALPVPALVDWSVTTFTPRRGSNPVRTATGAGLGYAYGVGLWTLFVGDVWLVLVVGAAYAVVAGCLIFLERRRQ